MFNRQNEMRLPGGKVNNRTTCEAGLSGRVKFMRTLSVFGAFGGVATGLLADSHFYRPYRPVMVAVASVFPSKAFRKAESDVFAPMSSFSTERA
jgi:hypothetical protein